GMYNVSDGNDGLIIDNDAYQTNADGEKDVSGTVTFTQASIDSAFHGMDSFQEGFIGFGSYFIAFALLFFCYTTMLAYYYIAETNLVYMLRGRMPWLKIVLGLVLIGSAFYGTVSTADLAWQMGDLGVGLMAWLTVIDIIIMHMPALKAFKDYERQYKLQKKGEIDEIVYTPERGEFKDHNFWVDEYPRRDEEGYSYPDRN